MVLWIKKSLCFASFFGLKAQKNKQATFHLWNLSIHKADQKNLFHIRNVALLALYCAATLISPSTFAHECPNLHLLTKNPVGIEVKQLVCEVLNESYPDIAKINLDIEKIEDSKLLSIFAGSKISFLSFFRLDPVIFKSKFYIAFSEKRLREPNFTYKMKKSVIAHELAHTVQWIALKTDANRMALMGSTLFDFSIQKKFENIADFIAIQRGIEHKTDYTQGLADYRDFNYSLVEEDEKKEFLISLYNFRNRLEQIRKFSTTQSKTEQTRRAFRVQEFVRCRNGYFIDYVE